MSTLPALDVARCVHGGRIAATCIACLAVCPRLAVHFPGCLPVIDADACDGCGLCVAACPRAAIRQASSVALGVFAGRPVAFAACDTAMSDAPGAAAGCGPARVACLHAIGLDALLRNLRAHVRLWLVARAPCAGCPRGSVQPLRDTLAHLNGALRARGDPGIVMHEIDMPRWARALAASGGAASMRRNLPARRDPGARPSLPEGRMALRQRYFDGPGPVPHAVRLDPSRCVACHACARVCPDGAIRCTEEAAYRIESSRCTGCGLCIDVCDHDALRILPWASVTPGVLAWHGARCTACGAEYNTLAPAQDTRCRICRERGGARQPDRIRE